jgi:hypothetical protein
MAHSPFLLPALVSGKKKKKKIGESSTKTVRAKKANHPVFLFSSPCSRCIEIEIGQICFVPKGMLPLES